MRNTLRTSKPLSLLRNGKRWKRELLESIKVAKRTRRKVDDNKMNRYNNTDVKKALKDMYNGLCCYCESEIANVAYEHIEHRKPKAIFPELTYEWENLHLSCPKCNMAKSNKWDKANPILDAVTDVPIENHLTYKSGDTGVWRLPLSKRGKTTVEHTDLNRDDLRRTRLQILGGLLGTISLLNSYYRKNYHPPEIIVVIGELTEKCKGQYGTLVKWSMDEFLDDCI